MIPSDVDHFIIHRAKWIRGQGIETKLLDEEGNKDCFGFFMLACGFREKQIFDLDEPIDVIRDHEWITQFIRWEAGGCYKTKLCCTIIRVNDSDLLEDQEREMQLKSLFKTVNITLEFVN